MFGAAFDPEYEGSFPLLAVTALQVTAATGRVLEVMKRLVRDGRLDQELLEWSLRSTVEQWGALCRLCGIDWREVFAASQAKSLMRKAMRESAGITTPALCAHRRARLDVDGSQLPRKTRERIYWRFDPFGLHGTAR